MHGILWFTTRFTMVYYGKLTPVKLWFTIVYYGIVPWYTTVPYQGKLWCRTMVNYGTVPWYTMVSYHGIVPWIIFHTLVLFVENFHPNPQSTISGSSG